MFVAMNRFQINPGMEDAFENAWRSRESQLQAFEGFQQFSLLKNQAPADGPTEYISHTVWASRAHFDAWRRSQEFNRAHSGAGGMDGVMAGPPQVSLYEAVIVEGSAPVTA